MLPLAIGLDLGSTRIKAGLLAHDGSLIRLLSTDSPALRRTGAICVGDASEYVTAATGLLEQLSIESGEKPNAGLSCQRSSFVLQDLDGRAVTPMISWQDTRAAAWCRDNRAFEPEFHRATGLMLSAHYVGPKLASIAAADPQLARALLDGEVRLRTLDTLLIDQLGGAPSTDPTMAARTGLFDIEQLDWSEELCARFGLNPRCLPHVRPSDEMDCVTAQGVPFRSSLADQSAGLLGLTGADSNTLLINLGTGGFVLRPIAESSSRILGYLTGILRADRGATPTYALEGAISGCGPAMDQYRSGRPLLEAQDPTPDLFAVPDGAGLGAPHWRPDIGVTFSQPQTSIDRGAAYRALLEGLLFRVREIHDGLMQGTTAKRVALAGGLSAEPFVAQGLATLLGRTVERIDATEVTLRGAAIAACDALRPAEPAATSYAPSDAGNYLEDKYARWRGWLASLLR